MLDVETLLECIFDAVKNRVKIPAVLDHGMSAQSEDIRCDRPDVKIMNLGDPFDRFNGLPDFVEPDTLRNRLHEYTERFLDQTPGRMENEQPDENANQRISHIPTGLEHDQTGGNGSHRAQRIAHDVQEGSAQI